MVVPSLISLAMSLCLFQSCIVDTAALKHQTAIACSTHTPLTQHQQTSRHQIHPFWQPTSYLHSAAYVEIRMPAVIQCTTMLNIYHLKLQHHHQKPPLCTVVLAMCLQNNQQQCRTAALVMCLQSNQQQCRTAALAVCLQSNQQQCHHSMYLKCHWCYHTATMAMYCRKQLPPHIAALAMCLYNKQQQCHTVTLTVRLL